MERVCKKVCGEREAKETQARKSKSEVRRGVDVHCKEIGEAGEEEAADKQSVERELEKICLSALTNSWA